MALKLNVYEKGGTDAIATGTDTEGARIKGLAGGTIVKDGDYQATYTDDTGALKESGRVDVPGFTVEKAAAEEPTEVKSAPTTDGANVTAG